MSLDVDALVAAHQPPTFTKDGQTWTGRVLSFEEFQPYVPLFQKAQAGELETHQLAALLSLYLRAVFPRKWAYVFGRDPVQVIRALPSVVMFEVIGDFLASQARSMGATETPKLTPSPMSGHGPRPVVTPALSVLHGS